MYSVIGSVLLISTLTIVQPLPTSAPAAPGAFPFVPTAASVVPSAFPYTPGTRPIIPSIANPVYNYAGAPAVPILTYSSEHGLDGAYAFSFTTGDGKQAQESGYLKDAYIDDNGNPQGTQVVQGSYAYISPEGTPIQVSYVADENGFRPSGVHISADGKIPIPPVVPVVDGLNKPIFDSTYNRYDPYANRNRYNPIGQFNNRPYDSRYRYDPKKLNPYYPKNNFNRYQIVGQNKNTNAGKKIILLSN